MRQQHSFQQKVIVATGQLFSYMPQSSNYLYLDHRYLQSIDLMQQSDQETEQ